ncbi:uncharacterized protein [Chaetodon trifascialis]|uniref:uncharacterized protein n=1 Tax=Chaetodon trifascialis TaxID=109706 RepID=UPI0039941FCC
MDLSLLPTPVNEDSRQRTGARFTVRSANSPSYSLIRRPGVRKPRGLLEEEKEDAQEVGQRERYVMHTGTYGTNKEEDHTVTGYQARTGSHSSVKGQCEEKETSGHKMSTKPNQNDPTDKTVTESGADRSGNCNPASESCGRTDLRSNIQPSRSNSLDWRKGERSPDWVKKADMFTSSTKRGGDASKWLGDLDERRTGVEGMRGRVMSSVQTYNAAGTSKDVQGRSSVSHVSQPLDRASRGHSLPSRLRSQSGPSSGVRGTTSSFEPNAGQSILERIEKLFESAGRDFSTPVTSHHKETAANIFTLPQQRSYERAAGGTFPRRFSSEEKSSPSPMQRGESIAWTQKDTREGLSGGLWKRQTQGRYLEESGVHWSRGLEEIGTRSLDRARSRHTIAAQIRSARAAGEITAPPQPSTCLREERSVSFRDSFGARERRVSGSKDEGRVNHGEEKSENDGINRTLRDRTGWLVWQEKEKETDGTKGKTDVKSSSTDDVFESNSQKIRMKTIERKTFPDMLSVPSAASVKNKISQFEALTQRSQGLATGQVLTPRRAFSVPTQLSRDYDGVKNNGSAKATSGLRNKCEGLKEGEEAGEKTEEKGGRKCGSERSLSVDEVGLRSGRKGNALVENERKETSSSSADGFERHSRLKRTLEIPVNGGAQRLHRQFYIDETDFSKVSSPEEASNRPPFSIPSNSTDTGAQKTTPSPVSDEDKTPTNTPNRSPLLSPNAQLESTTPIADSGNESTSVLTRAAEVPERHSPPLSHPLATSSHSNLPDLISPDVNTAHSNRQKQVLDLNAWVAGLKFKVWNDDEDGYEDDDESTQKDEDSNYDSDSGESSVTITSNMSQSDRRSFCVSLSDLCNFAGVDYESDNDSDEWQSRGRRTASLSSDMSALSCVSVLPSEELDRLLEDVRSLGDNNLQDYDDVQVVVLHKEVGVGLGFSVAGGVDQNKPVTVHKVFPAGVAAQEGSIREGDQVLSINGTSLCGYVHWEALRVLRRAKTRDLGVVVLRRGGISSGCKGQTNHPGSTQTQFTETGQRLCVCLEKNSRDLGFSLEGGIGSSLGNRPLTVQKIFQGGPADKVCPSDEVLEIGGVSVVGMRRLEAWTLIRRLPPGPVDVVLRRPLKNLET